VLTSTAGEPKAPALTNAAPKLAIAPAMTNLETDLVAVLILVIPPKSTGALRNAVGIYLARLIAFLKARRHASKLLIDMRAMPVNADPIVSMQQPE